MYTQDFNTVPRGWKVRTVSWPSGHEVRLAFPPGRRKPGSGRLIQILHPHGRKNPNCAAVKKAAEEFNEKTEAPAKTKPNSGAGKRHCGARPLNGNRRPHCANCGAVAVGRKGEICKLCKRAKNPDELEQARHTYKQFHGKEPKEIIETQISAEQRKDYVMVGPLEDIDIIGIDGRSKRLSFHSDKVMVASSPNGKTLYLVGGNQQLPDELIRGFGADPSKDQPVLGFAAYFTYWDRKKESRWKLVPWRHQFGEDSGHQPVVLYDKLKQRVFFAGGSYYLKGTWVMN